MKENLFNRMSNVSIRGEVSPIVSPEIRDILHDRCQELIHFNDYLTPEDVHNIVGDFALLTGYTEWRSNAVVARNSPEAIHHDTQVAYQLTQYATSEGLFKTVINAYEVNHNDSDAVEFWSIIEVDNDEDPVISRLFNPNESPTRLAPEILSGDAMRTVLKDIAQAYSLLDT